MVYQSFELHTTLSVRGVLYIMGRVPSLLAPPPFLLKSNHFCIALPVTDEIHPLTFAISIRQGDLWIFLQTFKLCKYPLHFLFASANTELSSLTQRSALRDRSVHAAQLLIASHGLRSASTRNISATFGTANFTNALYPKTTNSSTRAQIFIVSNFE